MRSAGLDREPNKERRSLARLGLERKGAGIVFEDLPADEQPQARAVGLGREEGLEEPAAVGDRDASTVVFDRQDKPALFGPGGHMDPSLVVGRVDRVQDQVQDDLGQVVAHAHDRRQVGRHDGRDRAFLGALVVLGDPERLVDDLADPDAGHGRGRRPREVDQLADRPLDPLQLARGQIELFGGVRVGPAPFEDLHQ